MRYISLLLISTLLLLNARIINTSHAFFLDANASHIGYDLAANETTQVLIAYVHTAPKNTDEHDSFSMLNTSHTRTTPQAKLVNISTNRSITKLLHDHQGHSKVVVALNDHDELTVASITPKNTLFVALYDNKLNRKNYTTVNDVVVENIIDIYIHPNRIDILSTQNHHAHKMQHFNRGIDTFGYRLDTFDDALNHLRSNNFGVYTPHTTLPASCYDSAHKRYSIAHTLEDNTSIIHFDTAVQQAQQKSLHIPFSVFDLVCQNRLTFITKEGIFQTNTDDTNVTSLHNVSKLMYAHRFKKDFVLVHEANQTTQLDFLSSKKTYTLSDSEPLAVKHMYTARNGTVFLQGLTTKKGMPTLFGLAIDATGTALQYQHTVSTQEQFKRKFLAAIKKYNLLAHFNKDDTIVFDIHYAQGSATLNKEQKKEAQKICARLFEILKSSPDIAQSIKAIRLQGATSSEWSRVDDVVRHTNNTHLSVKRAKELLEIMYNTSLSPEQKKYIREHVTVEGVSMTQRVTNSKNLENFSASRRNQITLEWK